mgnify:CR=1 FL=1|tara:strand:- start:20 stop:331 length:312 start_codon:yes stop_codon:yes gene_type:complete
MDENYLEFPNLKDEFLDNVFRKIDPLCQRTNGGITITFPKKFIEISDLSLISATTQNTFKTLVSNLGQNSLPLTSPILEDKIYQDWLSLKPTDLHRAMPESCV